MGIKVEQIEKPLSFPSLMIGIEEGTVVLMSRDNKDDDTYSGTLLKGVGTVGEFYGDWVKEKFTPFNGTLELSND